MHTILYTITSLFLKPFVNIVSIEKANTACVCCTVGSDTWRRTSIQTRGAKGKLPSRNVQWIQSTWNHWEYVPLWHYFYKYTSFSRCIALQFKTHPITFLYKVAFINAPLFIFLFSFFLFVSILYTVQSKTWRIAWKNSQFICMAQWLPRQKCLFGSGWD